MTAAISIVPTPTATPRCTCAVCRHSWARLYRDHVASLYAEHPDPEASIAERWHAYYPAMEKAWKRLPARARDASLKARETTAIQQIREWADSCPDHDPPCIVVLSGPPGTGKTVSACWLALHRYAFEDPALVTATQFAMVTRKQRRWLLRRAGMVILDDLGVEHTTRQFVAALDEIVDSFYQRGTVLVITTNCTGAQFKKRYSDRVVDRLRECGTWIPVVGKSMRGAK